MAGAALYPIGRCSGAFSLAERRPRVPWKGDIGARVLDAIDVAIKQDGVAARIERRLGREQRKLRRLASDTAWAQYLRVESAHMDRSLRWLEVTVRWAARERKRPRRRLR